MVPAGVSAVREKRRRSATDGAALRRKVRRAVLPLVGPSGSFRRGVRCGKARRLIGRRVAIKKRIQLCQEYRDYRPSNSKSTIS